MRDGLSRSSRPCGQRLTRCAGSSTGSRGRRAIRNDRLRLRRHVHAPPGGEAGGVPEVMTAQIGGLPGGGCRPPRFCGSTTPRIVIVCAAGSLRRLAWASTSAAASIIVAATATHPQEQDTAHGAVMALGATGGGPTGARRDDGRYLRPQEQRVGRGAWPSIASGSTAGIELQALGAHYAARMNG
jgi:hypothetical protein